MKLLSQTIARQDSNLRMSVGNNPRADANPLLALSGFGRLAHARLLTAILTLVLAGCSSKTIVTAPSCPPPPVQTVVITAAQIGQTYSVEFAAAPVSYAICGTLPPGFKVTVVNGKLWLTGKAPEGSEGTYKFWIGQSQ